MTIPTIKRRKWHGKMRWQATDYDGESYAYRVRPEPYRVFRGRYAMTAPPYHHGSGFVAGPKRRPPADWTSTLRRIEPAKKGRKG